jgi:hypothetical protein
MEEAKHIMMPLSREYNSRAQVRVARVLRGSERFERLQNILKRYDFERLEETFSDLRKLSTRLSETERGLRRRQAT